jgi:hypothetical protein
MYFILQGALFASGVAADVCLSSLIQGRNNVKERGATSFSEDTTVTKAVILSIPYKATVNAEVISSSIESLQPFEALHVRKAVADVTARKVVHDMDLAIRKALSVSWTKIFISTGRQRLFAVHLLYNQFVRALVDFETWKEKVGAAFALFFLLRSACNQTLKLATVKRSSKFEGRRTVFRVAFRKIVSSKL